MNKVIARPHLQSCSCENCGNGNWFLWILNTELMATCTDCGNIIITTDLMEELNKEKKEQGLEDFK